MTKPDPQMVRSRLSLESRLADLAQVPPWVAELAEEHGIPGDTRFEIELCLEEILSNIVRHGYAGEPGHALTVDFSTSDGGLIFVVEDCAPPFEPKRPGDSGPQDLNAMEPGGQGLRLLYRFADSVQYERLARGNRVTLGFRTNKE